MRKMSAFLLRSVRLTARPVGLPSAQKASSNGTHVHTSRSAVIGPDGRGGVVSSLQPIAATLSAITAAASAPGAKGGSGCMRVGKLAPMPPAPQWAAAQTARYADE